MVTQADVSLADELPKFEKAAHDLRVQRVVKTKEEEERREVWNTDYYRNEGQIRAAEDQVERAARARIRIYDEVPLELRRALDQAGAELRGHAEVVDRARMDFEAAQAVLEQRRREEVRTGFKLEKHVVESMMERIMVLEAAHKKEQGRRAGLEAAVKKAQAAVDADVQRVRRAAKK